MMMSVRVMCLQHVCYLRHFTDITAHVPFTMTELNVEITNIIVIDKFMVSLQ